MPAAREPSIKIAESWIVVIVGIVTILGVLAGGLALIRTANMRIDAIEKTAIYQRESLDSLNQSNTNIQVTIAGINARLDALDAQLADLKASLIRINNLLDQHASTASPEGDNRG